MGVSDEVDRTLFVGNLDPQVTEELLFELFLQAGPLTTVKIPKDNDGRPKQFAFINFKHDVSPPYGMNLFSGTKLFGRPLKIQFRSGSSHQEGRSPGMSQNSSPSNTPVHMGRPDLSDQMGSPIFSTPQMQRSFSSPESLQRQALMNNMLQLQMQQLQHLNGAPPHLAFQQAFAGLAAGGGGAPGLLGSPWQQDNQSPRGHTQHQHQTSRHSQHHQQERSGGGGHYSREQRYSDSGPGPDRHRRDHSQRSDFYHHDDRGSSGGRSRDYPDRRRDSRDARYRRF